jgi:hypothetical protein
MAKLSWNLSRFTRGHSFIAPKHAVFVVHMGDAAEGNGSILNK